MIRKYYALYHEKLNLNTLYGFIALLRSEITVEFLESFYYLEFD